MNGDDAMLYTKIAGLYADTGNYEQALSAYKKAVRLRPNDAFIYISMGNILQTMGDYDNAYKAFSHAQEIYPEYKYNYLNLANIEYVKKNYTQAIKYYNSFLSAYPDHKEASENLANVYYINKQPDLACDIYSNIYKKYPSAFTEFEKYGMALFSTKQYRPAAEMLEKALADDSKNEAINARLALTYQNLGENDKALNYFKKTFEINPELTSLKFDYANLLGNMGKNDEAIKQYKDYLTAYPNDADAYRNLGIVYKAINDNELALFNFEKSYSLDSSNLETKKELALAYHNKKDYNNALKFYDLALKSEPENVELLANKALTLHAMENYVSAIDLYKTLLAKTQNDRIKQNLTAACVAYGYELYDKQDYGQAVLYFEDAIDLNDKEASAYFGYAMANAKIGCADIALENYEKAVSLEPNNSEYAKALSQYKNQTKNTNTAKQTQTSLTTNEEFSIISPVASESPTQGQTETYDSLIKRGNEAYRQQKYDEAIDSFSKAVIYNPADKSTMLKIANVYRLKGNNSKAISFYDKVLMIDKGNTDAYFNKGLVLANQKQFDESIKCFEKVIELSPEYPYAYYSLGLAYEQKGIKDKAVEYYTLYTGIETDDTMINIVNQKIKNLEGGN